MLSPTAPKKNTLVQAGGLLVIMLLVILCSWPGMHAPLFTDDIHQLEKSINFTKWTDVFGTDVFGFYRPVKNALFMAAAPLANNLVAWHWIGLAAYLAATAGIYRIVRICLDSPRAAWFAAFFWALSPSCVSTVIWLSCANISIGLVFAACVFHFHERRAMHPSAASTAACLVFFALSLVCYESMIAIPALLFVRDLQQRRIAIDRKTIVRYGLYCVVALAFLFVRHLFSAKSIGDHNFHPGFAPDTKPIHLSLSAPWFLWRHFLMWAFPFGTLELLGSYAWLRSASAASLVAAWFFLAALLGAAAFCWKRCPAIAYGILFFVVASLPAGNFVPNFNGPINDAYVTIPSIGLAMVFATACEMMIREFVKRRRQAESGGIALAAILGVFLLYRIPICGAYFRYWASVWQNPSELMLLSSGTRPFQFQPKAYVSVLLLSDGYLDPAEKIAKEVVEEAPWNATARLTLARIAEHRKDHKTAEEYYRFILATPHLSPFLREPSLFELAKIVATDPARKEETADLLRQFLKNARNVPHPDAIGMLAQTYKDLGNLAKARATLERGLKMVPHDPSLEAMLAALPQTPAGPVPQTN